MSDYKGRCHCGAIGFRFRTALVPAEWAIRACQCSFCRAHDALSASDPHGELCFIAEGKELLRRYRFGLRTADFLLCSACGVYIGALIDTSSGQFGIINTHALQPQQTDLAPPSPIQYDSEDATARVDRRIERWTPVTASP
ncbi:MAG: hypothetical protein HKN35_01310 [Woeseia sp.]|nr:hypothetical protein [Woeseia sp.]MBT8096012.1 hypothetical protein [Woeseia sp.]NNE59514.1 hypothetical protein [Woeseia sp.]NNL54359.1 hypothetical protein [Woeseia sp.]